MSKRCCFAGHSKLYGTNDMYNKLISLIERLIKEEDVSEFWVGNYGDFDRLCAGAVRNVKRKHPHIELNLVIPYLTSDINNNRQFYYRKYDNIIIADLPEGTPKRFWIIKCNEYMVQCSDFIICYVQYSCGGAAKTMEYAKKRESIIIYNLGE